MSQAPPASHHHAARVTTSHNPGLAGTRGFKERGAGYKQKASTALLHVRWLQLAPASQTACGVCVLYRYIHTFIHTYVYTYVLQGGTLVGPLT